ncbi:MAG: hypothetical protein R3B09_06665 [Nannocystaceae bacterium]
MAILAADCHEQAQGESATAGATSEATSGEDERCERRELGATSTEGFRWSLGCAGSSLYPGLAVTPDGSAVLQVESYSPTLLSLGGDEIVVGGGSVVLTRVDGSGHHVWSQAIQTHQAEDHGLMASLPDGGVVLALPVRGPIEVGGVTVEVDSTRLSLALIALDPGGHPQWHAVLSGASSGSVVHPESVRTARSGLVYLGLSASDEVSIDDEGPFEAGYLGVLAKPLEPGVGVWRVGAPPEGVPLDVGDDGSLLLATGDALVRTDASWETSWERVLDGTPLGFDGAISPKGDVVVVGLFGDRINLGGDDILSDTPYVPDLPTQNVFLGRFTPDGEHRWSASRSEALLYVGVDVDAGEELDVVLITNEGRPWIERISETGETLGVVSPPVYPSVLWSAGTLPGGGAVLMGITESPIDLGGGAVPLRGEQQLWLARYGP